MSDGPWVSIGASAPERFLPKQEYMGILITVVVLFFVSGTGIYGSLISGMSGDHSILIAKSIPGLFTALIFACMLVMAFNMIWATYIVPLVS